MIQSLWSIGRGKMEYAGSAEEGLKESSPSPKTALIGGGGREKAEGNSRGGKKAKKSERGEKDTKHGKNQARWGR